MFHYRDDAPKPQRTFETPLAIVIKGSIKHNIVAVDFEVKLSSPNSREIPVYHTFEVQT